MTEVITREQFTGAKLLEIYQQAYLKAQIDADGDVHVEADGIKILARVDPARGVMRLVSVFGVKPHATRQQVLELCNRVNDGLILIRATCPAVADRPMLLLDHYTVTDAGVTGEEVVDETRRFRVVVGGIGALDTEDILT